MYLKRRRRLWYALHDIPADVRPVLGKARFRKSLETEDRKEAEIRAAVLKARWLSEIKKARAGSTPPVERDALYWRKVIQEDPEAREHIEDILAEKTQEMVYRAARKAGIAEDDPRAEDLPEHDEAMRFFAIATGKLVPLEEHLEEYLATLRNEPKTVDMKRTTILRFCQDFHYVQDVKRKEVQRWVNRMAEEGKAVATIQRALSELRGYWRYLISIEAAPEDLQPFAQLSISNPAKRGNGGEDRKPFKPADVVRLLKAAEEKGDHQLADLIRLGMWTGARIEELCALKLEKVEDGFLTIEDAKTDAGWRDVPIHSKLKATAAKLAESSKDGYLLSGLSPNKYDDRSTAIGKRFGRLKTSLGFGPAYVFHSIRKTVASLLQDAGVPEFVSADILGHDKPTMTYGLYAGKSARETMREALEKIDYPWADDRL